MISGRSAPVEMAQPDEVCQWVRDFKDDGEMHHDGGLTERRVYISADQAIPTITLQILTAKARNPPLGEPDGGVNLAAANGRDHVAGARGEGDEGGIEAVVLLGEVEGRGEVLWHIANAERLRRHGFAACTCLFFLSFLFF